jgi:hypothetical protein
MVMSVSKGPGHEKIFDIYARGNEGQDSENADDYPSTYPDNYQISEFLLRFPRDYLPQLYTLCEMDPRESEPYGKARFFGFGTISVFEIAEWDIMELFFCNDGALDGMASISCCLRSVVWFNEVIDKFIEIMGAILGLEAILELEDVSPESSQTDVGDGQLEAR